MSTVGNVTTTEAVGASPSPRGRYRWSSAFPYVLVAPTLLLLGTFTLWPLAQGFWMALFRRGVVVSDRVPATWPRFVGLDNFRALAADPEFLPTLGRTVAFVCVAVPLLTIVSLGLAVLLKPAFRGAAFVRAVVFFPSMVSLLIIGVIWKWMFGFNAGVVNYALSLAHLAPVPWLEQDTVAQLVVILVWVWANAGFFMMIFIAGLTSIPEDLYEAASIDAATPMRGFLRITVPLLQPTIALVVILSSVEAFKVYELVVSLTHGGPGRASVYLIQVIYETAFSRPNKAGVAAAESVVLFAILLVLTLAQLRFSKART